MDLTFHPDQPFDFPSKSDYIFIFRESDPYCHLVLNNWVFLSDLFYKMNENVKQNQPVSLFSFLILRVAGLLNSADFSRSCTSSSCNISLSFSSSALTQARRRRRLFPIACLDSRLSSLTPSTVPKCLAILGRWKTRSCILGATLPLKTKINWKRACNWAKICFLFYHFL